MRWRQAHGGWHGWMMLITIIAGLVGLIAIADGWLERAAWLAGTSAALVAQSWLHRWRYARFLVRTDRAWIASLGEAGADRDAQYDEMMERLVTPWDRCRRGRALAEAIPACLAWIGTHERMLGQQRELVEFMCAAVREGARDMPAADAAACLNRLRDLLIAIDRGRVGWIPPIEL